MHEHHHSEKHTIKNPSRVILHYINVIETRSECCLDAGDNNDRRTFFFFFLFVSLVLLMLLDLVRLNHENVVIDDTNTNTHRNTHKTPTNRMECITIIRNRWILYILALISDQ